MAFTDFLSISFLFADDMSSSLFVTLAAPAVESTGNPAVDIARQFHIDWPFFIAQCISFAIVLFVLKKFAFGPIQAMLEQRRQRIAEGEEKLKRIETQLAESEATTAAAIEKANEEAQRLINEAKDSASSFSEKKAQEAIASAQNILAKAEEQAKADRAAMTADLKKEFGRLVASTTAGVAGKVLDDGDKKRINDEALATLDS